MCVARVRILNKTTPSFDNLSRIWLFERKYKKLSIKKKRGGNQIQISRNVEVVGLFI